MLRDRARRLAGPLAGAALLVAPSPIVPNGSVDVRPQSEVVAAGDQLTIRFEVTEPDAVLLECAVGATRCDVAESGSSAVVIGPVPIRTRPGPVILEWTASVLFDPVEGPGPPETGTVQLTVVPPEFTVVAQPSQGPPGTSVRVLLQPVNPKVQIRGCSAGFSTESAAPCESRQEGPSVAVVVPEVRAGPADINWELTYAGNVRDEPLPASGRIAFDVRAPAGSETQPPSTTATTPAETPRIGTPAGGSPPNVIAVADDDLPGGLLLLLLLLPLAGVLYAVRRVQSRATGVATVHSRPGLPQVSAISIYDRPVHSLRVVTRSGRAGPRVHVTSGSSER